MKFCYITDMHFMATTPSSRVGDYFHDCKEKLKGVVKYCIDNGIKYIVHGGDVFERKKPHQNPYFLTNWLSEYLLALRNKEGIKFISVVGNHDFSTDIENLDRQPIQNLFLSGAMIELNGSFSLGNEIAIHGRRYSHSKEAIDYKVPLVKDRVNINVVHSIVIPDGRVYFGGEINFGALSDHGDVILCGDYHPGFDTFYDNTTNTHFVNPGSFGRTRFDKHDVDRIPKMAIIDIELGDVSISLYNIPGAKVPEETFDFKKHEVDKRRTDRISTFVDSVKEKREEEYDVNDIESLKPIVKSMSAGDEELFNHISSLLDSAKQEVEDRA